MHKKNNNYKDSETGKKPVQENNPPTQDPASGNSNKTNNNSQNSQNSQNSSSSGSSSSSPNDGNKPRRRYYKPRYPRYRKPAGGGGELTGDSGNRQQRQREEKPREEKNLPIVKSNQMVSVVVPLLNEEGSLKELAGKIENAFAGLECKYEVIFVDDGSTDSSYKIIRDLHSRNNRFHCIKFRRNYGKSAALAAGFKKAKGDYVITMDADLQDDPAEIPELLKVLNSGYDLVSGWKKVRYDPFIKKHTSKLFNYFTSKIAGIRLHDFNCGLKAYKKDVVKNVKVYGEMHRYIPALAHLSGFKVTEKPVKHHARKYGVTKFGPSRFLNGFLDLLTVAFTTRFITKPLHLFGFLGIASFFAGFITLAYLTYLKYFESKPISDRPLFLIGILFVIVGVQFLSLGLIAEMITKSQSRDQDALVENDF